MSPAVLFAFASVVCAGGLAIAAAFRAGRLIARWAFAAGTALLAVEAAFVGLGAFSTEPHEVFRWREWRLIALSFLPVAWLVFSVTFARGDRFKLLSISGLPVLVAGLVPLAFIAFRDRAFLFPSEITFGVPAERLGWSGVGLYLSVLLTSVVVVMNLERTFRASVGTIRWRIKYMLVGVGVIFVARIYTSSQTLVFRTVDIPLDTINAGALIIATPLILRSLFRAGHLDLDVYPSQSVLQSSVTVLLAGIYLLIIGVLAKAVTYFGGDAAFALKAFLVLVALVALAVVLQSDHARLWLRRFVSRHFQRPLYDYRTVWRKFTEATASRVDQRDLSRAVAGLVADVFQCLSVNVWTLTEKGDALVLSASTSVQDSDGAQPAVNSIPASAIVGRFQADAEPVDIESSDEPWAALLRDAHRSTFPHGGHRVCVPLVRRGELLGVITMGDRVGGAAFSLQDFEMLKCVGDHFAASLMNTQLSNRLLQARELEAFQTMATFFVHDLKNAASTLSLMLQNLPIHFDNPEFRADALRGVSKTVTHINRLIGRLGALRHELKVELAEDDLNEVVDHALAGLEQARGSMLEKEIVPLPRIPLDREQLNKVVTNLVLNATEAVSSDGRVRIKTGEENGWVVLTVADNGCGMSDDFLKQSLFRPFQTTKKSGLGIGMFHSKMIVEAHGGRISVASKPGQGTTFQVFLRAPRAAAVPTPTH